MAPDDTVTPSAPQPAADGEPRIIGSGTTSTATAGTKETAGQR
jgi:hypothetical protein